MRFSFIFLYVSIKLSVGLFPLWRLHTHWTAIEWVPLQWLLCRYNPAAAEWLLSWRCSHYSYCWVVSTIFGVSHLLSFSQLWIGPKELFLSFYHFLYRLFFFFHFTNVVHKGRLTRPEIFGSLVDWKFFLIETWLAFLYIRLLLTKNRFLPLQCPERFSIFAMSLLLLLNRCFLKVLQIR